MLEGLTEAAAATDIVEAAHSGGLGGPSLGSFADASASASAAADAGAGAGAGDDIVEMLGQSWQPRPAFRCSQACRAASSARDFGTIGAEPSSEMTASRTGSPALFSNGRPARAASAARRASNGSGGSTPNIGIVGVFGAKPPAKASGPPRGGRGLLPCSWWLPEVEVFEELPRSENVLRGCGPSGTCTSGIGGGKAGGSCDGQTRGKGRPEPASEGRGGGDPCSIPAAMSPAAIASEEAPDPTTAAGSAVGSS
mmetsp:Transcript_49100/g.104518  ORF Transcript_49100/g.104518 Transcript_49100/m.104518 type:complete len:254 (+) Transcript_49100:748-1509(+)